MAGGEANEVDVGIQIDRLIHASDGSDARQALSDLIEAARKTESATVILQHEACRSVVLNLIATGCLIPSSEDYGEGDMVDESLRDVKIVIEDGTSLSCDLLTNLLSIDTGVDAAKLFIQHRGKIGPSKFGVVHCLLDALSSAFTFPFEKIHVISILRILFKQKPQSLQEELIRAPDGMHRAILEPAFGITINEDGKVKIPEEMVRNEALVFAREFSEKSPVSRQLLVFNSGLEYSIRIAIELEGGLWNLPASSAVILDCLGLCRILVREEEAGGQELLGSQVCMMLLMNLLDLRNCASVRRKQFESSKKEKADADEDLDDLLGRKSASSSRKAKKESTAVTSSTNIAIEEKIVSEAEEQVIIAVLKLFMSAVVASHEITPSYKKGRQRRQQLFVNVREVCCSILDMALFDKNVFTGNTFKDIATPSENMQLVALHLVTELIDGATDETRVSLLSQRPFYYESSLSVVERILLLFSSCSRVISNSALPLFRLCLSSDSSSMTVMHTLAPPPIDDVDVLDSVPNLPLQKLLDTLVVALFRSIKDGSIASHKSDEIVSICGALGVFLNAGDFVVQEMFLRLSSNALNEDPMGAHLSLVDLILKWIATFDRSAVLEDKKILFAKESVLRLVCEWCFSCPNVVRAFLSSPENIGVKIFLSEIVSEDILFETSLSFLVIGIWLDTLDEEWSGWSRPFIVSFIESQVGLSLYTRVLEAPRVKHTLSSSCWESSDRELKHTLKWYSTCVDVVRKRLIEQITGNTSLNIASSEENPLAKLVEEQNNELNQLRGELKDLESVLVSKKSECTHWKSIVEARSPDEALNECVQASLSIEKERDNLLLQVEAINGDLHRQVSEQHEIVHNLNSEVSKLRDEVESRENEKTMLKNELSSIAIAYANLEGEFRKEGRDEIVEITRVLNEKNDYCVKLETKLKSLQVKLSESKLCETDSSYELENSSIGDETVNQVEEKLDKYILKCTELENEISKLRSVEQKATTSLQKDNHDGLTATDYNSELSQTREKLVESEIKYISLTEDLERLKLQLDENENQTENVKALSNEIDELQCKLQKKEEKCIILEGQIEQLTYDASHQSNDIGIMQSTSSISQEEFDKLKATCIAADEWMAMAVERMNAMVAQNTLLVDEIKALKNASRQITNNIDEVESLKSQLQDLQHLNETLHKRLENSGNDSESIESVLSILKAEKVAILNEKSDEIRSLNDTINSLNKNLELVNIASESDQNQINHWREENERLTDEIKDLESRLCQVNSRSVELEGIISEHDSKIFENEEFIKFKEESDEKIRALNDEIKYLNDKILEIDIEKNSLTANVLSLHSAQDELAKVEGELKEARILITELESSSSDSKTLQEQIHELEEKRLKEVSDLESKLEEFQEWSEMAQNNIKELEKEKESGESRFMDLTSSLQEVQESLSKAEYELNHFKEAISSKDKELERLCEIKDTCIHLESSVENLKSQLDEKEVEVAEISTLLQSKEHELKSLQDEVGIMNSKLSEFNTISSELERIRQQNDFLLEVNTGLETDLAKSTVKEEELHDKIHLLDKTVEDLNSKLKIQTESFIGIKEDYDRLTVELDETINQSENVVNQWQDDYNHLQKQMHEEAEAASGAITQWENRCTELSNEIQTIQMENETLSSELEKVTENRNNLVEAYEKQTMLLKDELTLVSNNLLESRHDVAQLTKEIDETVEKSEEVVAQWVASNGEIQIEFESQLQDVTTQAEKMEATLREELDIASDAIFQWEERCNQLTKELAERTDTFYENLVDELQNQVSSLELQLDQRCEELSQMKSFSDNIEIARENLNNELEEVRKLFSQKVKLHSETEASLEDAKKSLTKITDENNILIEKLAQVETILKDERDRAGENMNNLEHRTIHAEENVHHLQDTIERLTEELRLSQDKIQVLLTDVATLKATEAAVAGLRDELRELKSTRDHELHEAETERQEKAILLHKLEQLREDFSFILSAMKENDIEPSQEIQNILEKATQGARVRDKREIDELRFSLKQALEELEKSNDQLRSIEEKNSRSELTNSIKDQETICALKEVASLKANMAKMKAQYEEEISLLQDKLQSSSVKQNDHDHRHREEIAILKAQLSQSSLEKGKLENMAEVLNQKLKLLKDIKDKSDGGSEEIEKLSLEKAELLSKAAEEAANAEKRIREAVSTCTSSLEAEVITEKELRLAAEGAIEELQRQLDDAHKKLNHITYERSDFKEAVDRSFTNKNESNQEHVQQLKEANTRLNDDNLLLQDEIKHFKAQCEQWKEKVTRAEDKVRKESQARHDAQIELEMAKRESLVESRHKNQSLPGKRGNSSASEVMHDRVQELQMAVNIERKQYKELLEEHETLLAVLAQQDLERTTLCTALAQSAGKDAVEQAIENAQQTAIQKFGEYIQVSSQ